MRGSIAICGAGTVGLITSDTREVVDCGTAWVGIHLTDKLAPIGSRWQSRNPRIIGHISSVTTVNGRDFGEWGP